MSLRVMFMGMLGAWSAIPLQRLCADEAAHVCAVVVPMLTSAPAPIRSLPPVLVAPRHTLNVMQPTTQANIIQLAHAHRVPVYEVNDLRDAQTLETLRAVQPDVIVVSCFPFILPRHILALPPYGCFNLHPALLPKLRGPEPLFWVFHAGAHAGVTLHCMTARVDAGDIVAQTPLAFPDGITYAEAESLCAHVGAELLVNLIHELVGARHAGAELVGVRHAGAELVGARHASPLRIYPQDEREASYAPLPSSDDFIVIPDWSAWRAFNFMRGVMALGQPIIQVDDERFVVREALTYQLNDTMREAYRVEGERLWVRFADGVAQVRI